MAENRKDVQDAQHEPVPASHHDDPRQEAVARDEDYHGHGG
jgi:hypothetical protein